MRKTSNKNNSTPVNSVCAIVFVSFTFCYLFFFQADLLFMVQHVLSGGTTHYNRTIGAVLLTTVLYLIQLCLNRFIRFDGIYHAISYIPSLTIMALLTSADTDFDVNGYTGKTIFLSAFILAGFIVFAFIYTTKLRPAPYSTSSGQLWKSLFIMCMLFLFTCAIGNTDRVFHYRLKVEGLIRSKDYKEALTVGEKSDDTDESLTMLRIFALSRTKQLGERLFEYPIPKGGSEMLLPDGAKAKCMSFSSTEITKPLSYRKKGNMDAMQYLSYIENQGLAMKSVSDYLLCGYLLDKNLDGFVKEIVRKYNVTSPSLPKHYKEALTLYTHLRANPILIYHSEIMDADYADFQKLEKTYSDERLRRSYVRDTYGNTYWFYYFYH